MSAALILQLISRRHESSLYRTVDSRPRPKEAGAGIWQSPGSHRRQQRPNFGPDNPANANQSSITNQTKSMKFKRILFLVAAVRCALPVFAQEHATTDIGTLDTETAAKVFPTKPPYSPYAGRNFPVRPFFGDTHLHTSISVDAGAFGCRLTPVDAYRFAKGEEVTASSGQPVKLSRPLDFLVVADHSDLMGLFPMIFRGDPVVTPAAVTRFSPAPSACIT